MPFFSPTMHKTLTPREQRELPAASSETFTAIPQILTKHSENFLWAAAVCMDLGYEEVNLNLGCPSGTVVAKGKGSGMLRDLNALDGFLCEIFAKTPIPISIKTRLGLEDAKEFPEILEILNRYPIRELTIHPRVRKQFYSGPVDRDMFRYATENSKNPLCYNGDLNTVSDIAAFSKNFPRIDAVMLGRGLVADPGMLMPGGTKIATLEQFMTELLEAYITAFGGSRNAMFRLKENWGMLLCRFPVEEKLAKRLRKTTDLQEYKSITAEIFSALK